MKTFSTEASAYISNAQIRHAPQMEIPHVSDAAVLSRTGAKNTPATNHPVWLRSAFSYLVSLQQLQANWDGENSPPPSQEIIDSVCAFLQNRIGQIGGAVPQIEPTRVGGILLSWQNGPHDLEVDFEVSAVATFVYVDHSSVRTQAGILCSDNQPRSDLDDSTFQELVQRYFLTAE